LKDALKSAILEVSSSSQSKSRHHQFRFKDIDFRKPWPLTALVAFILGCIYFLIYLVHLVAFFGRRARIKASNKRRRHFEVPEPIPDFTECQTEMQARFCCNLQKKTVTRLFIIIVFATAGGCYLFREGYFESIKDKLVPLLYLGLVVVLILQVFIAQAWERLGRGMEPVWRFHSAMSDVGNSGFGLLSQLGQSFGRVAGTV